MGCKEIRRTAGRAKRVAQHADVRLGASGSGCNRPRGVAAPTAQDAGFIRPVTSVRLCRCGILFNSERSGPILTDMEQFTVTERAAARIAEIMSAESRDAALRVAVLAGGCSGFQYRFELEQMPQPDDLVVERGGAKVLIDPASLGLLAGAELDFTDALMGSHFALRNPSAKSACGCGTSFSID